MTQAPLAMHGQSRQAFDPSKHEERMKGKNQVDQENKNIHESIPTRDHDVFDVLRRRELVHLRKDLCVRADINS